MIKKLFGKNNIPITEQQAKQFQKYYEMIVEWNQKINLTSITEYEKVIFKSTEDIYNYSCIVGGAKTGINNKKLIMSIYSEDNLKTPKLLVFSVKPSKAFFIKIVFFC